MILFKVSAFYFLKLLIQFIIRGNNTFGMGVWYGTVVWDGIFVPYYIPNHRTVPGFTVCLNKARFPRASGLHEYEINDCLASCNVYITVYC